LERGKVPRNSPFFSENMSTVVLILPLPFGSFASILTDLSLTPEQEHLITNLQQQNTQQNALYTLTFTLLPLLLTLPFILTFPTFPLLSVLGITSLFISAGRMRFFSPPLPPHRASLQTNGLSRWLQLTDFEHRLLDAVAEGGPLRMALPWLNVAICAVLGLAAVFLYRKGGSGDERGGGGEMWIFCLLPGIALMMVEVALRSMRDVEKGVGELDRLRYRYKGA
jgi:hypothetical protein